MLDHPGSGTNQLVVWCSGSPVYFGAHQICPINWKIEKRKKIRSLLLFSVRSADYNFWFVTCIRKCTGQTISRTEKCSTTQQIDFLKCILLLQLKNLKCGKSLQLKILKVPTSAYIDLHRPTSAYIGLHRPVLVLSPFHPGFIVKRFGKNVNITIYLFKSTFAIELRPGFSAILSSLMPSWCS